MQRTVPVVVLALVAAACASSVPVRTESAPDLTITGRNSFSFLPLPRPADGVRLAANDPMADSSTASLALRDEVRRALESRGYRALDGMATDMLVAVYAAATQPLDFRRFDYGYSAPRSMADASAAQPPGTVVVDLVDPASRRLLWRGVGVASVSSDPTRQLANMESVVDAIAKRLPRTIP